MLYQAFAVIFVAQAFHVDMNFARQVGVLLERGNLPSPQSRRRLAEARKALAESGEGALVMSELGNAHDAELAW